MGAFVEQQLRAKGIQQEMGYIEKQMREEVQKNGHECTLVAIRNGEDTPNVMYLYAQTSEGDVESLWTVEPGCPKDHHDQPHQPRTDLENHTTRGSWLQIFRKPSSEGCVPGKQYFEREEHSLGTFQKWQVLPIL